MIEVKNLRIERPKHPWDMRVDRVSVLGNPFRMKEESERDLVCELYKEGFEKHETNSAYWRELQHLYKTHQKFGKLNLFCWCAPKRCHADTIKEFLERFI